MFDYFEAHEGSPFLVQMGAETGHGPRLDPPDIRMMSSRSHIEHRLPLLEHRSDDGHIR
jgi:hypothetical protein